MALILKRLEGRPVDSNDWRQAEDAMLTALQLQQEAGVRPEIARSYTIYAGMLAQVGQRERAAELLAKATEIIGELGMVAWNLDRVQELLNQPQA
jgi:hypothetical protein